MAVATAMVNLRTMGGAIGVQVLGTILVSYLNKNLSPELVLATQGGYSSIMSLPVAEAGMVFDVYTKGLRLIFIVAGPLCVLPFLLVLAIKRERLQITKKGAKTAPTPQQTEQGGEKAKRKRKRRKRTNGNG